MRLWGVLALVGLVVAAFVVAVGMAGVVSLPAVAGQSSGSACNATASFEPAAPPPPKSCNVIQDQNTQCPLANECSPRCILTFCEKRGKKNTGRLCSYQSGILSGSDCCCCYVCEENLSACPV
jgi:hypothetical protein